VNWVKSRNDFGHDVSTMNIAVAIIIVIIAVVDQALMARQRKRDSMLFGDVDEPPLMVAGGATYQPMTSRSDTALTSSSGGDVSAVQTMTSGARAISEPAVSRAMTSRESLLGRSDDGLLQQLMMGNLLIIPAKARDYVFTGVGLSVCLSVCLFVTTITK